jgi:hypothetical protein
MKKFLQKIPSKKKVIFSKRFFLQKFLIKTLL